jgi:hypothetical protein
MHAGSPTAESQVVVLAERGGVEPDGPGSVGAVVAGRLTGGFGGYTAALCKILNVSLKQAQCSTATSTAGRRAMGNNQ